MSLQRLRIVAISDTHGQTPHLPPGDILIHAGDLCQQGTPEELRKVITWLEATSFRLKIVIAGNHDVCLDPRFRKNASHGKDSQAEVVKKLLRASTTIQYLEHETRLLRLQNEDGSEVPIKIFGSPFTPSTRSRAFGYIPEDDFSIWEEIPLDADIVIAHTPAKYHLDESFDFGPVGCPRLREALWRIRPKLFVCGHIHESRGAQVVEWDIDTANFKYKEGTTRHIFDKTGDSKKQFRLDLSSVSNNPLSNDGSKGALIPFSPKRKLRGVEVGPSGISLSTRHPSNGQGGKSASSDQEALLGREGRQETCVVNASYLSKRNLSCSSKGGRAFNKPIVIDMDFQVDWRC